MPKNLEAMVDRAQTEVERIAEEIGALDDEAIPAAAIVKAKGSIGKIHALIESLGNGISELRELMDRCEDAANKLEDAQGSALE